MAISASMALVSTAVTGGLVAAGVTGAALLGGSFVSHFLITTALGAALNALTPKPSIGGIAGSSGGQSGYKVTSSSSVADHQVIYGKTKVAGVRVFDETTGSSNQILHRVVTFTGHEIESFEEIYINDELATVDGNGNVTSPSRYSGYMKIYTHLGTDDQEADANLVSEVADWTTAHRLRGIAYMYLRMTYDQDKFPNGVPEVTAVIKGKKVYDPRTETTAWSDNPALCLRDYLTNTRYGLGEVSDNIDDTQFIVAANVCDYYNYPTLTGDQRYTCNGAFTTAVSPYDVISNLISSMGGLVWYAQGKWRTKPAYWTAASITFDEDDLRSSISVATRHSRNENFNKVNGTWSGEASNWQPTDFPPVSNADFIAADNNQEKATDLNLSFTSDVDMARRIANIYLERNRQQLTVQASFGMRAFQVQVGDTIKLRNSRFGWGIVKAGSFEVGTQYEIKTVGDTDFTALGASSNATGVIFTATGSGDASTTGVAIDLDNEKEFEVIHWTFGLVEENDLQCTMTLREISESVFDDISDGAVYERDNTTLPSPFFVTPVGISVEAIAQVSNQKVSNIASITVSATTGALLERVEVEFKKSSADTFKAVGTGPLGVFEALDLETGTYDFRARGINTLGVRGDWELLEDQEINAFIGDPSDVTGLEAELSGGTLFLSWTAIPDADLSHYVVKHNSSTTGATWGTSTTVVEKIPRPATSASLPARSGTYLIRAYDKEDNFSENVTTVVILPSDLPQLGTTDTQTEDPSFSGTLTNAILVSSSVEIDDTTAASPTGEYEFSAYIDTGSVREARVTGYRTFERRFDDGTLLWDDIPQNWDTWPDNWDTWTDENANFGDIGVTVYVARTDDDPAGTPTWSSWEFANGAEYTGRAFKFKAVLTSDNTNYTPAILTLSADVEY